MMLNVFGLPVLSLKIVVMVDEFNNITIARLEQGNHKVPDLSHGTGLIKVGNGRGKYHD